LLAIGGGGAAPGVRRKRAGSVSPLDRSGERRPLERAERYTRSYLRHGSSRMMTRATCAPAKWTIADRSGGEQASAVTTVDQDASGRRATKNSVSAPRPSPALRGSLGQPRGSLRCHLHSTGREPPETTPTAHHADGPQGVTSTPSASEYGDVEEMRVRAPGKDDGEPVPPPSSARRTAAM